jgi:hypothetical protein
MSSTDDYNEQQQRTNNPQAPISSGQQSSAASGQGGSGGYSMPESGHGQRQGQENMRQPKGGYSQEGYNEPGSYSQSQGPSHQMQNGYRETQGSGYGQEPHSPGQAPEDAAAQSQQGYNPALSGVQPAKHQPGEHVDAPGRETGTARGEDLQMGSTTDPRDRKNPAD